MKNLIRLIMKSAGFLLVLCPLALAQTADVAAKKKRRTAAEMAAQQVAKPADGSAQVAAAQGAQVSTRLTAKLAIPANALERAQFTNELTQQPCIAPTQVMRVSAQVDNSPMERPKPLTTLKGERDAAMEKVSAVLLAQGFTETGSDPDTGEIQDTREDKATQGARDDVLIWIDGQAGDAARVRVYLLYGRYEKFFGSTVAQRIVATDDDVQQHVGTVKQAIHDLSKGVP